MPGPGGGSRGGGFGGGGFGGGGGSRGGFGGGGFGGPRPGGFGHGPHRPHGFGFYHYPFGFRRRYYYGGGGCLGGLLGAILAPVVVLALVLALFIGSLGSLVGTVKNGGDLVYDEAVLQEYANDQYAAAFGSSSAYEDHLLIVFLTNEASDSYYCIAWIGDNVKGAISDLFGNERTAFGRAMLDNVADYHAYSLSANLAGVMEDMTEEVERLNLSSSFRRESDRSRIPASRLINYSSLSLSADTVESALHEFTEATDIATVIVVDQAENVFERESVGSGVITTLLLGGFAVLAIVMIVQTVRTSRKGKPGGGGNGGNGGAQSTGQSDPYSGGERKSSNPEW